MQAETLARIYETCPAAVLTGKDRLKVEALINELFNYIPVCVVFVIGQPYKTVLGLTLDIQQGVMRVSIDNNTPCFDLMSKETNLEFRAVHDWHHYLTGGKFNLKGEFKAYLHMRKLCSTRRMQKIMFSEIVLQAAYAIARKEFAPQKVVI